MIDRISLRLTVIAVSLFAISSLPQAAFAQDKIPDEKRAVLAFDIRLDSFRNGELFRKTKANRQVKEMLFGLGEEFGIPLGNAKRIFGAVGAPASMDELSSAVKPGEWGGFTIEGFNDGDGPDAAVEKPKPKPFPFEFFLQIQFENGFAFEFSSELFGKVRSRSCFSANLNKIWAELPNSDIRIALDVDGAQGFVDELVAMMQSGLEGPFQELPEMLRDSSNIGFAMDPESDQLLNVYANSKNAAAAEKFEDGLNVLIPIFGQGVRSMLSDAFAGSPDSEKGWNELVASMKPKREGNVVSINVARTESFEKIVVAGLTQMFAIQEKQNLFKQIGLGIHNYHDTFKRFPISPPEQVSSEISWRVLILPFIEYVQMYDELDPKRPWSDEINKKAADKMPLPYGDDGKNARACWIMPEKKPNSFSDIRDGTSNTIVVLEFPDGVPWMQPKDLTIDEAVELVSGLEDGKRLIALFYDGSVGTVSNRISAETLRNLFDPNDGEEIDWAEIGD